jgi:hypothetical protein
MNQIKELPPQHMQVLLFLVVLIIHLIKYDCVISCIFFRIVLFLILLFIWNLFD